MITEEMIDNGADALRVHQFAHRQVGLRDWHDLPNSTKKKWRVMAEIVLRAALQEPE